MSVSPISGEEGLYKPMSSSSSSPKKRKYSIQSSAHSFMAINKITSNLPKQNQRKYSKRKNKNELDSFHKNSKSGLLIPQIIKKSTMNMNNLEKNRPTMKYKEMHMETPVFPAKMNKRLVNMKTYMTADHLAKGVNFRYHPDQIYESSSAQ